MGHAFAVNLVEDGYLVSVYDRDPKQAAALAGARSAAQLAGLADCDVVVTSLPNDDALLAVALSPEGLAAILAPNAVHISRPASPTVTEASARRAG
jgi:3-hydroxyisobutyrate dehydrogenase-like beta-hydroxyacid dehydrogenase